MKFIDVLHRDRHRPTLVLSGGRQRGWWERFLLRAGWRG